MSDWAVNSCPGDRTDLVNFEQVKYPYLVAVVGVCLIAATTIYGSIRAMFFRAAFRGGFNGTRQFGNPMPFGYPITSGLTLLAIIIAIVDSIPGGYGASIGLPNHPRCALCDTSAESWNSEAILCP